MAWGSTVTPLDVAIIIALFMALAAGTGYALHRALLPVPKRPPTTLCGPGDVAAARRRR